MESFGRETCLSTGSLNWQPGSLELPSAISPPFRDSVPINAAKAQDSQAKPGTDAEYLFPGIPVTRATSDVFVI